MVLKCIVIIKGLIEKFPKKLDALSTGDESPPDEEQYISGLFSAFPLCLHPL